MGGVQGGYSLLGTGTWELEWRTIMKLVQAKWPTAHEASHMDAPFASSAQVEFQVLTALLQIHGPLVRHAMPLDP